MFGGLHVVTLQQLVYFRELALNGHLTHTAEKLYITQATLSNVIINLEKQLGVKLFVRAGRSLQLSDVGAKYLEYVIDALGTLENGKTMIENYLDDSSQKLSVAANNSTVWASLIQDFRSCSRACSVCQLECSDPIQARKMLISMEVDFVIAGAADFSLTGLDYAVFRRESLHLSVPATHPLAGRTSLTLDEIKDEPFISQPRTHPFQKYCDDVFCKAGIRYHTVLECDYMLSSQLVDAGFGVRLTTQSAFDAKAGFLTNKNICIPIVDDYPPREIALIWNPRRYLSQAAVDFRTYVIEQCTKDTTSADL